MPRLLVLLFVLSVAVWAVNGPVPFVPSLGGDFAPEGFVGFYSTPARVTSQGFAFSFFKGMGNENDVDEFSVAAHGEFGSKVYRFGFFSTFHELDSLYRQSYSELDIALTLGLFTFGGAYGFSMEWIPSDIKWARHRYKGGAMLKLQDFAFGIAILGFTDEFVEFRGGVHWNPEGRFSTFVEGDGLGVRLGQSVKFKYGKIDLLYGFPSFFVSVMLTFNCGKWFLGGALSSGDIPILGVFSGKRAFK